MGAGGPGAVVEQPGARLVRVFMVMSVSMGITVMMVSMVVPLPDPGLAFPAAAYRAHHSTSIEWILSSSPPVT